MQVTTECIDHLLALTCAQAAGIDKDAFETVANRAMDEHGGDRRGAERNTGERGYERFPYLLNALTDLGVEPPFRSNRLWAFFDSSYRSRVDLDYFAARWRSLSQ